MQVDYDSSVKQNASCIILFVFSVSFVVTLFNKTALTQHSIQTCAGARR